MTESRYVKLLWIYVALTAAAITASFFPGHSENLAAAYESEPETWLMSHAWVAAGVLCVLALAWLTGLIGLFRFKGWARPLSLYSTLVGFALYPLLGTSWLSGIESALYDAATLAWGAAISAAYFSPVSERFAS
jgi:hypothetical protein